MEHKTMGLPGILWRGCFAAAGLMLLVACSRTSEPRNDSSPAAGPAKDSVETKIEENGNADPATATHPSDPGTAPASATDPAEPRGAQDAVGKQEPQAESKGQHSQAKEPLFVDWPQPRFVLLISGQQMGYIEPCGCTGLVNQKGGLARRHTLARQLAERGWPVVPLDVGNQIRRFGRQAELKFQITGEALRKIGYRAIALGADDLRLSVGELAAHTAPSGDQPTPFLSANAAVLDASLTPTHQVVEAGGKKIGITSVVSDEWQKKVIGGEILLKPATDGLDAVLPAIRDAGCDLRVLLVQGSTDETEELARKYPDFQIVVTAGGGGEPPFQPQPVSGTNSLLVQVGLKGMFAIVLGYFDDPQQPWRYQRVPLDSRFEDSREMLELMASYQEHLKVIGLEGLGIKAVPHPSGRTYVGSEKCGECHTKAYAKWQETGHSRATDSLVHPHERSEIPRHFDPECLSCHVTGWHPQQYFPYDSGYLSLDKTPRMTGSGCENCHGPGSAHVAAEEGEGNPPEALLTSLRESMRLPLARAETKCLECHDLDNSPDFHATGAFAEYWSRVEHKGMD
jgi:hypothetical protein